MLLYETIKYREALGKLLSVCGTLRRKQFK